MNILITGGAGFIGYHLARHHQQQGDRVFLVDNLFKTKGKMDRDLLSLLGEPGMEYLQGDLTRGFPDLPRPLELDVVYHLAAINGTRLFYEIPYQVARDNLLMTLNLLRVLEEHPPGRLIYTSTSEAYANAEKLGVLKIPTAEDVPVVFTQPTNPRFSYGTSKFMGEFLCLSFGKQHDVPTTVVRYHNIYGPRMGNKHVIPEFVQRIVARENPFRIYGGEETRAFCFVEDAVRATEAVAQSDRCVEEIIHIGNSEEEITIEELARLTMELMEVKLPTVEAGRKSGSVARRCPDTSRLLDRTGFRARWPLQKGLVPTINWYLTSFGEASPES